MPFRGWRRRPDEAVEKSQSGGTDRRRETLRLNTVHSLMARVKRRRNTTVGVSSVIVGHQAATLVLLQALRANTGYALSLLVSVPVRRDVSSIASRFPPFIYEITAHDIGHAPNSRADGRFGDLARGENGGELVATRSSTQREPTDVKPPRLSSRGLEIIALRAVPIWGRVSFAGPSHASDRAFVWDWRRDVSCEREFTQAANSEFPEEDLSLRRRKQTADRNRRTYAATYVIPRLRSIFFWPRNSPGPSGWRNYPRLPVPITLRINRTNRRWEGGARPQKGSYKLGRLSVNVGAVVETNNYEQVTKEEKEKTARIEEDIDDPSCADTWRLSLLLVGRLIPSCSRTGGCERADVSFVFPWYDSPWHDGFLTTRNDDGLLKRLPRIVQRREMIGKLLLTFWILRWTSYFGERICFLRRLTRGYIITP